MKALLLSLFHLISIRRILKQHFFSLKCCFIFIDQSYLPPQLIALLCIIIAISTNKHPLLITFEKNIEAVIKSHKFAVNKNLN